MREELSVANLGWRALPWLAAAASGGLLAAPYLCDEAGWLGWVALIPLAVWVIPGFPDIARPAPFRLGFVGGLTFWGATLFWIRHTSALGMLALVVWLALFPAAWAWALGRFARRWSKPTGPNHLLLAALGAAAWVALEALRGRLLGGFPWNTLAVSQVKNLALIQIAAWTGASGISWLVAFFNLALGFTWRRLRAERFSMRSWRYEFSVALALVAACLMVGMRSLMEAARSPAGANRTLRLALVQPNIPQEVKFEAMSQERQKTILRRLTLAAVSVKPDAVLWPETALTDGPTYDARTRRWLMDVAREAGTPILFGAVDAESAPDDRAPRYFNAAMLVSPRGVISAPYRKLHLLPFGEYIPFERTLPFMKHLTPIPGSFYEGRDEVLFDLNGVKLGPLICFEDTVAEMSRDLVRAGAEVLVNLTNDAWFKHSPGAAMHLRNATLRAVETRRPLVRCTNSGVTAVVSPWGQEIARATPFEEGFLTVTIAVHEPITFFVRHGDLVATACALAALLGLVLTRRPPSEL
ncbi:MAG: apolipoprotein N-acyltransferase [Verrucomicrobiae bacterium]|nr:apolipoprotein N-acyltransferase [Verrucomicrobiae bacterium]